MVAVDAGNQLAAVWKQQWHSPEMPNASLADKLSAVQAIVSVCMR
jgi:hypothetical protein